MTARDFLAGHPIAVGARHGMIAPARRAAYDALRAVATRTRDLGEALAEAASAWPTSAIAR